MALRDVVEAVAAAVEPRRFDRFAPGPRRGEIDRLPQRRTEWVEAWQRPGGSAYASVRGNGEVWLSFRRVDERHLQWTEEVHISSEFVPDRSLAEEVGAVVDVFDREQAQRPPWPRT